MKKKVGWLLTVTVGSTFLLPCLTTASNVNKKYLNIGDKDTSLVSSDIPMNYGQIEGKEKNIAYNFTLGGKHGQIYGGATIEDGLSFDGKDNYVNLDSMVNDIPNGNASVTVEAWVKMDAIPPVVSGYQNNVFVAYGGNNFGKGFSLQYEAGQKLEFIVFGVGRASSYITPEVKKWYHMAGTYDHQKIRFYLNGELKAESPATANILGDNTFRLGNEYNRNYWLNGAIKDVRLWNVVRTSEEIKTKMDKKLQGTPQGLVGYWGFN